jgi:hypothetical protein
MLRANSVRQLNLLNNSHADTMVSPRPANKGTNMSLQQVYADAWRTKYGLPEGWIVNLEPTYSSGRLTSETAG